MQDPLKKTLMEGHSHKGPNESFSPFLVLSALSIHSVFT